MHNQNFMHSHSIYNWKWGHYNQNFLTFCGVMYIKCSVFIESRLVPRDCACNSMDNSNKIRGILMKIYRVTWSEIPMIQEIRVNVKFISKLMMAMETFFEKLLALPMCLFLAPETDSSHYLFIYRSEAKVSLINLWA